MELLQGRAEEIVGQAVTLLGRRQGRAAGVELLIKRELLRVVRR